MYAPSLGRRCWLMFYIGVWKFSFYPERRTETTEATEVGWTINIEMYYENNTQLPWGCLQDAAIIRKEIYTVIIINSEDSVNKSVCNATYNEL